MILLFITLAFSADAALTKLTYFNVRGRGEAIRLALEDNKIPYENDIVEKNWKDIKKSGIADGTLPFGQVPRLITEDGTAIVQGNAILREIGRKYDLYGKKPYLTDMIIEAVEDWRKTYTTLMYQDKLAKDKFEEYKEKLNSKLDVETGGTKGGILEQYESLYVREKQLFFGGASPGIADYALYALSEVNKCFIDDLFVKFPNLDVWFEIMTRRTDLNAYINAGHPWRARNTGAGVGDCKSEKVEL